MNGPDKVYRFPLEQFVVTLSDEALNLPERVLPEPATNCISKSSINNTPVPSEFLDK